MNKLHDILVVVVSILCLFASCSEANDIPGLEPFPDESYVYNPDSVSDIAKALVNLQPDIEMCNEVHAATQKAISLGLDESYYFVEILGKGERITKTSEIRRSILSKIESLSDTNHIKQLYSKISGDSHYMRHYQIYWPYSQKWNGSDLPVITFKTKESPLLPQDENIGYRIKEGFVETVLVNEEYAKQHPVWIINYNPIPYEEYPDFAEQNWISTVYPIHEFFDETKEYNVTKYTIYSKGTPEEKALSTDSPEYAVSNSINLETDTLSLYLKNVSFDKKDKRLHSLFSGGAHYIFNIETIDINDINLNNYTNPGQWLKLERNLPKSEMIGVRFVFLRSEIEENTLKIFDQLMSWRWLHFEISIPLSIVHEFGGGSYVLTEEIIQDFKCYVYIFTTMEYKYQTYAINSYLGRSGIMPLRLNDELLQYGECQRSEYIPYEQFKGMMFYDQLRVTDNITCELDVTKGMSIPSWYTPTAQ